MVGWGSWAFQGGKGGSPISVRGGRAPTGRLIKLLRERYAKHVFIIDEYKTSKVGGLSGIAIAGGWVGRWVYAWL